MNNFMGTLFNILNIIVKILYFKLIVRFLFYFNPNYKKSPFIKNEKRGLKKSKFSWEKVWEVRNEKTKYIHYETIDKEYLFTEEQRKEIEIRNSRHEVLDFPLVWQPEIVDEKDDWRYRRSLYFRKGILRIVLHTKWELENLNDLQKGLHLFKVFGTIFFTPLFFAWLFCNRMELMHMGIEYFLLNDYLINKIGFKEPSVYSAVVRLYYTNYIDAAVNHLIAYSRRLERELVINSPLTGLSQTSVYFLPIKRGVNNHMVVNKIVTEVLNYYNKDLLSEFICKEILIDFAREQKININLVEMYMEKNRSFPQITFDLLFAIFRTTEWRIKIPLTNGTSSISMLWRAYDVFGPSSSDAKKGFCYDPNNEFSVWAFENAILHGISYRPPLWWRYDYCGGNYYSHRIVVIGNHPTLIEELRNVKCKYTYPSDIFISIIKKIYRMVKPKNNSFFWTITYYLDTYLFKYIAKPLKFLLRDRDYLFKKDIKLALKSIKEGYANFISFKNNFVNLLNESILGPYLFLEHRYSYWKQVKSRKVWGQVYHVWERNNNRFFRSVPYPLVFKEEKAYGINWEEMHVTSRYSREYYLNQKNGRFGLNYKNTRLATVIGFGYAPYIEMGAMRPIANWYGEDYDTSKLITYNGMENDLPNMTLDEMKDRNINFSSLEIFWPDYDLGVNTFANLISLNLFVDFLTIIFLFSLFVFNIKSVRTYNSYIVKKIYFFFWDLFKSLVLNVRLERFFSVIISYFLCIIFFNLGGFSFYELSFMSHVSITFFFSFSIFINYIVNLFINFNELFYLKFVQKANIVLVPFLFLIEIVSFFVRPFSLGIRLFANVMSGHILMHMFFSTFIFCYKISFWVSFFIFGFCLFIFFMELFVSFIQAYIFMILLLVYSIDLVNIH